MIEQRRTVAVAGPSLWNSLPAALRRPEMTLHTSQDNWRATCMFYASDKLMNRSDIHHRQAALFWRFCDFDAVYKIRTYLLTSVFARWVSDDKRYELLTVGRFLFSFSVARSSFKPSKTLSTHFLCVSTNERYNHKGAADAIFCTFGTFSGRHNIRIHSVT